MNNKLIENSWLILKLFSRVYASILMVGAKVINNFILNIIIEIVIQWRILIKFVKELGSNLY